MPQAVASCWRLYGRLRMIRSSLFRNRCESLILSSNRFVALRAWYPWVIWLFSTLGFLFSVPGQTMGMGVFTDYFIEVLDLTRTELSLAYLVGTLGSAACLTRAGRWFDVYGGRVVIALSSLALALVLVYISVIDQFLTFSESGFLLPWLLILMGYFGVRFFGQGVLTSASRNILLIWFLTRRGLVSGMRGIFVSLGFALAPLGLAALIAGYGWRGALWILAAGLIVFAAAAWVCVRARPQRSAPEGGASRASNFNDQESETQQIVGTSLAEAKRNPVFWLYACSLSMHALFGTALTFHIVSIFQESGRGADEAFAYFLPAAICSTLVNLVGGALADSRPLKPFLVAMLAAFLVGAIGLAFLTEDWGYWLLAIGFGVGGGLWGVLSNLAFVRYFGLKHLGEISGLNTALTVSASAIGPAAFSLGLDFFDSYQMPVYVCIAGLGLLLCWALWQPSEQAPIV